MSCVTQIDIISMRISKKKGENPFGMVFCFVAVVRVGGWALQNYECHTLNEKKRLDRDREKENIYIIIAFFL